MKKMLGYFGIPAVLIAILIWALVGLINQPYEVAHRSTRLRTIAESNYSRMMRGCVDGMVVAIARQRDGISMIQLRHPDGKFMRCNDPHSPTAERMP